MGIVLGEYFANEVMRVCGIDKRYVTSMSFDIRIGKPMEIHITRFVSDEETKRLCEVMERYTVTMDNGEEQQ